MIKKKELEKQIKKLARFIMDEVEGEPSQSQGAVDTAIRIIKEKSKKETFKKEFEDEIKLFLGMNGIEFVNKSIESIFSKYIGKLPTCGGSNRYKVKIKARKGKIVIERIK